MGSHRGGQDGLRMLLLLHMRIPGLVVLFSLVVMEIRPTSSQPLELNVSVTSSGSLASAKLLVNPEKLEIRSLMTGQEGEGAEGQRRIPGIAESRYVVLQDSKPWADKKECGTGQDPFVEAETKLVQKYYEGLGKQRLKGKGEGAFLVLFYKKDPDQEDQGKANCQSNQCNFDVIRLSYVCGPPVNHSFLDGRTCIQGLKPPKYELEEREARKIDPAVQKAHNEMATEIYGKFCKSKKCYYHFLKDALICASTTLQPSGYLALGAIFLSVLISNKWQP